MKELPHFLTQVLLVGWLMFGLKKFFPKLSNTLLVAIFAFFVIVAYEDAGGFKGIEMPTFDKLQIPPIMQILKFVGLWIFYFWVAHQPRGNILTKQKIEQNDTNITLTCAYSLEKAGETNTLTGGNIKWTLIRENEGLLIVKTEY